MADGTGRTPSTRPVRHAREGRIAVITDDVLAARMAGPAIRALHIAEALAARQHTVELISTARCDYTHPGVTCRYVSWGRLRAAVRDADVVIFQGFVSYHAPWLLAGEQILVIDLYDPIHLEQLEQLADRSVLEQRATIDHTTRVLNEQVSRGDFFLCASEQQRALWLGQLAALGPAEHRELPVRRHAALADRRLPVRDHRRSRPCRPGTRSRAACPASASTTPW